MGILRSRFHCGRKTKLGNAEDSKGRAIEGRTGAAGKPIAGVLLGDGKKPLG